ncbi:MAG: hypothetical protein ACREEV_03900 [Dongiaceae bacterium]
MRPRIRTVVLAAGAVLALPAAGPAAAQEMFAGTWVVVDAKAAPWVDGSSGAEPAVNEAMRQGRITFAADRVDGPPPLGCGEARYEVVRAGPEYLFQGGLADPATQAAALGFGPGEIVHLSLGCVRDDADIGMDFSLVDADTALFALDNVVYRMVRAEP